MPFSGKDGKVAVGNTDITDVLEWSLNLISELKPYASNATSGRRKRVAGHGDLNGTVRYAPTGAAAAPLVPGTQYTLKLYEDATHFHECVVKVGQSQKVCNVDTGDIVSYVASYEGDGAYTPPSYS